MDNLIYPMTFVAIDSDAFVEHGVKRNDVVFVVGTKSVPVSEEDPYTQRVKMFVHKINPDNTINYTGGMYLMDPKSLSNISQEEHDLFEDINFPKEEDATVN